MFCKAACPGQEPKEDYENMLAGQRSKVKMRCNDGNLGNTG